MTTLPVPGINISILRQQTVTQRGVPLLVSGRVSALGLPIPALVRVSLEGPDFDPQVTNFDTFASPTGDYSVPIIADQDGQYTIQAKAFPPIVLPLGVPGLPSPIDILPPVAASPSPPVVVGDRINGVVRAQGPEGTQRLPVPPQTTVEVSAPVSVSSMFPITVGGGSGGFGIPFFPQPTGLGIPDQPGPQQIIVVTEQPPPAVPSPTPIPSGAISGQVVGFTLEG